MGKVLTQIERKELYNVYEKTLGDKGANIFTYTDFLKDSGNNMWDHNFITMFLEYFENKPFFSNSNLLLIDNNKLEIFGFNITENPIINYLNNIDLLTCEIDNYFLESIPTLTRIGRLKIPFKHYFNFVVKKGEKEKNCKIGYTTQDFDYESLFGEKNQNIDINFFDNYYQRPITTREYRYQNNSDDDNPFFSYFRNNRY